MDEERFFCVKRFDHWAMCRELYTTTKDGFEYLAPGSTLVVARRPFSTREWRPVRPPEETYSRSEWLSDGFLVEDAPLEEVILHALRGRIG
jgi:hypothetical protein